MQDEYESCAPKPRDGHAPNDKYSRTTASEHLGDGGIHLITFHPPGGAGSSKWLHDEDWLDFNLRQNGHGTEFTGRYDQTYADYQRTPPKPVIDGEPIYEGYPISFNAKNLGHSIAADVRRPLYFLFCNGNWTVSGLGNPRYSR